jgi:hypothetical protein
MKVTKLTQNWKSFAINTRATCSVIRPAKLLNPLNVPKSLHTA